MVGRGVARWLLTGGVIGPVLFVVVFLVEGWTRPDYDPMTMFVSLLSLSDDGWQQVANFMVNGVLILGGAVGLRSVLREGLGSRWGPILIGLAGLGLVLGGVFVTDPGKGYPPGAPLGITEHPTVTGSIHDLMALLVFGSLAAAMFVMARRFAGEPSRWALYSRLSAAGEISFLFASFAIPDLTGLLQRIAAILALGWVAQVMWRFRREAVAGL